MSHPELLKKFPKPGVQGFPAGACGLPNPGVPNSFFFLSLRRKRRAKEGKDVFRGHPEPRQKAAALCTPACQIGKKGISCPGKVRDDSLHTR